jgi:predicted transcriptional regulator
MKRTTIMLPDEVDTRLRYEARRRGVPLAELAREAIVRYLAETERDDEPAFFDLGEAGVPDGGRRGEEYVADAVVRHQRER